jgi:hypothetical protein
MQLKHSLFNGYNLTCLQKKLEKKKKKASIDTKFMVFEPNGDHLKLVYTTDDSIGYYKGKKFTIRNGKFVRELPHPYLEGMSLWQRN